MTEDQNLPPPESPALLSPPQPTLLERLGMSPVVFAALSLFLVSMFYAFGALVFSLLFGTEPTAANVLVFRMITGFGEIAFFLIPSLVFVWAISHKPAEFFRLRVPSAAQLLLPLIGVVSLQVMLQVYLVYQARIPLPPELESFLDKYRQLFEEANRLIVGSSSVPELLWVIVVVAVMPALAEEFLFRGLIQRSLQRAMSPLQAAVITGCIFGAFHLNPSSLVPLVVIGVYLGYLAYRADSLWVSMAAHFYNNAIAAIVLYCRFDDDYVVTGNAEKMSNAMLLFTFWIFGVIFILSTIYFARISRHRDLVPEPHEDDEGHSA